MEVADRLAAITPSKTAFQGNGFSCEIEGNWTGREEEGL